MRAWERIAGGSLVVAAILCLGVAGEVVRVVANMVTGGFQLPVLTRSFVVCWAFVATSGVAGVAGVASSRQLRTSAPQSARIGRAAAVILLVAGVVWLGLVMSPIIDLRRG